MKKEERESERASRISELKGTQAALMPRELPVPTKCPSGGTRLSNRTGGLSRVEAVAPQQGVVQRECPGKVC